MDKKTILLIITSAIVGCIVINTLILGGYHWHRAYEEWTVVATPTPTPTPKPKIDLGHEPAEIAMDMEYDSLKQMEKAIKEELKYRENAKK